jgi:hypothetical protein
MSFTSAEIKSTVAGYFRYKRQCPVVAFEASDKLRWAIGEPADVLVVTESRCLYEVEVKISLSDLKHDLKKNKHFWFSKQPENYPVNRFYFAIPNELTNDAIVICKELYPYAGLLSVSKFPFSSNALNFGVYEAKTPRILNHRRLKIEELIFIIKEQSGTVCRLSRDKALMESNYQKVQRDKLELEKLLKLAGINS